MDLLSVASPRLLSWLAVGLQLLLIQFVAADGLACRDKRLASEFAQARYVTTLEPAKLTIEQNNFHQTFKDIITFQPGHDVSLTIHGRIDVNRLYWSERKCKWFGLKCWYEPRERSNWQGIEERHILARLCAVDERESCTPVPLIDTGSFNGLKDASAVPDLRAREDDGLSGLTRRFNLRSVIQDNGVHRSQCTGARPSTCSMGNYRITAQVDVKPRVLMLQKLLDKPQRVDDLVRTHVVDDFIRSSEAARKVVACLYFGHVQRFFPEIPGAANAPRERLLKFIVDLDPDNEYRVELTSLLITSGAIDEALEGMEEQLTRARERYERSNHDDYEAEEYAKTLLNSARLWIEDRVATEGADLEVAVGLFSELAEVRKEMLEKEPWDSDRLEGLVRAQIERARLLSLIRTGTMLEQAEKGLMEALQWIPFDKSEEIAGENADRGLYASYSASIHPLPEGTSVTDTGTESSSAPTGFVHVHRVPSWSAQPRILTQIGNAMPPVWLVDGARNGDGALWHPDARQVPRSWRLFGREGGCKNTWPLSYLGGSVADRSTERYTHALFFLDSIGALWVHRPYQGGEEECTRFAPPWFGIGDPLPTTNTPSTVDRAARLIYAEEKSVFWVDAATNGGDTPTIRKSTPFQGTVQHIVASTDDQSVGFVVRSEEDEDETIKVIVMRSVYDADNDERRAPLFSHPAGGPENPEDALVALSSTLVFVRNGQSLDVFSRAEVAKKSGGILSDTDPVLSIDIGNTSNVDLFVHALGDDFAVLQLRSRDDQHNPFYGAQDARLDIRVGAFRYSTELGPQEAMGFKGGVLLSLEDLARNRFTVRVFAAGVNGMLHRTGLDDGLRIESTRAQGLTSERVVVLNATAMLLSTHVAEVDAVPAHRNVPLFNGHEIEKVNRFCADHSDWGCRVAPIHVPVPQSATGNSSGCGLPGVSDPILLIAAGRQGGGKSPLSSDVAARAKVRCDIAGRPVLDGEIKLLTDEFPKIATLESEESNEEYDGPVWRHLGPAGLVLPARKVITFAAVPHVKVAPNGDFESRAVLEVPVRLVRQADTLAGTVSLRSPYGIRHLLVLVNRDADGDTVENALVVADHPGQVVTYTGAAGTPVPFTELLPRRMVQTRFGVDGNVLLLGKTDLYIADGDLVRIEPSAQGFAFAFGARKEIAADLLMKDWNSRERAEGYMRFEFFGATSDLSVVWRPEGPCTVVENANGDTLLTFGVGRPAGISHLNREGETNPIVIQGGRFAGKSKPGLRHGLPFTRSWDDLNAGARGACVLGFRQ